jgi:hypothetical protein
MSASSLRPLQKKKPNGAIYTRVEKIEIRLEELLRLPEATLLDHCACPVKDVAEYVPSECLLHLVRIQYGSSPRVAERLFHLLAERVLRRLPSRSGTEGSAVSLKDSTITDEVYGKFIELISRDRHEYVEKLDYFEIRFDDAFASLRLDARKKAWRHENRSVAIQANPETGELPESMEKSLGPTEAFDIKQLEKADYRSRLDPAIDSLPPLQRQIVTLLRQEMKIESKDTTEMTIAKALRKSERTIRSHRDIAFPALAAILKGE